MKNTHTKMDQKSLDLLRSIREKDIAVRMAALEKLQEDSRGHEDVVMEMIADKERDIRVLGCGLVAKMKPAGAVKVLLEKMRDRDPNVREAACTSLGKFRSRTAVRALTEALDDEPWIAFAAACSLGEIGGKAALKRLLQVFTQGNGLKASAACQALLRWDDPNILDEIVATIRKWRGRKRDRFVRILLEQAGTDALDRLWRVFGNKLLTYLNVLFEGEQKIPLRLLRLAAELKSQEACRLILQELAKRGADEDDYPDALALFSGLHAFWENQLDEYLALPGEAYLCSILRACAATGVKIRESVLWGKLPGSSLETKREIARCLTVIENPSTGFIERLLSDEDNHVKGDAAEAAALFGMHELSPKVEELARNGFLDTRQKAFRSLCLLAPAKAQVLAERYAAQGNTDDKKVCLSAADLMDKERSYRLIQNLLHSRETRIVATAVTTIGQLIDHDARYLDVVRHLLHRKKVLPETLEIIKEKKLTLFEPRLLELLREPHHGVWTRYQALSALAAMQDEALFEIFETGIKDEHTLIKLACIKGLAALRQKRAAGLISPFLNSPDADLAHVAQKALDMLVNSGPLTSSIERTH